MTLIHPGRIAEVTYPDDYLAGAQNAIKTCLNLKESEKVTMITDEKTLDIAAALYQQITEVGSPVQVFILEEHGPRPMLDMPQPILHALSESNVGIYAVWPQKGEIQHRMQVTEVVERGRIRYAHMVGITGDLMTQGMRADFRKVDAISLKIQERTTLTRKIEVKTKRGTDLVATFSKDIKWIKTSGIISPLYWGNLPGGEVFTSPARVDGIFVVDGSIGDYFGLRYGDISATPLTIEIANSRMVRVQCDLPGLADEFLNYCRSTENGDRVGEFAVGTNLNVFEITGNLLQDEKIPGVHIAFGNPYGSQTGADWTSKIHIDVISRDSNIWTDGDQIMEHGIFMCDKLGFDYTEGLDI
ncbi:MAG: aminopeptidase [Candidatus Xenobia bacterium]